MFYSRPLIVSIPHPFQRHASAFFIFFFFLLLLRTCEPTHVHVLRAFAVLVSGSHARICTGRESIPLPSINMIDISLHIVRIIYLLRQRIGRITHHPQYTATFGVSVLTDLYLKLGNPEGRRLFDLCYVWIYGKNRGE